MIKENSPLISIIVPVYNVEKYLPKCMDSIINQTLKDIEIICINDGTKDNSLEILNQYAKKDKRIKVISQPNSGLGSTRNNGIPLAKGKYISFIDSDDWIDYDFYEKLYEASNDDDIVMTTNIIDYYENKPIKYKKNENIIKNNSSMKIKKQLILKTGVCWNKIYRRDFLIKNDIKFYPKNNLIEDNYFTTKAYILASSIKEINNTNYYYRRRDNSMSQKQLTQEDFICLDIAKTIYSYRNLNPKFSKTIDKKIERELETFYRKLPISLKKSFKNEFKSIFPTLTLSIRKPLKWIFTKYKENNIIYYSIFDGKIILKRKDKIK